MDKIISDYDMSGLSTMQTGFAEGGEVSCVKGVFPERVLKGL